MLRIQGHSDILLDNKGLYQAHSVAVRLEKSKATHVYTSPLKRAKTTGRIIASKTRELVVWDELTEQNFGVWEGCSIPYVLQKYPKEYCGWKHGTVGFEPIGGETELEITERAEKIVHKILSLNEQEIIVTTHGGILRMIFIVMFGHRFRKFFWDYKFGNCSVSAVQLSENGSAELLFLNDCMHTKIDADNEDELKKQIRLLPLA